MKIDALTVDIINSMKKGRIRFKEIADKLSLAEGTVRSRVRKLEQEGILEIAGLVDPEKIPGQNVVYIGVKLKTIELVKKGAEISEVKGVIAVGVVTGRFDLILTVVLKKGFGLLEFYTEELSRVGEIQSVEAFVVYKHYNIKTPCDECSI
ncbi:MAG: Lrp/AsnC family transcriptional regulator [Deltaproteobacteria bacterium]|nr:Lrp/AsnC family transcriptional regulator [Deltaproteobacteria bacterium]MBT6615076.1 Lrp/AsnC family transcriptional regulator [Deltaproteobacteria bacterium]MBT7151673.1 Lrp/AsnC family transcriptional regulator [Deltaproteobacteria bacterium]MBT7891706.1 Lrp/AsnC family transcriptional regulator [Deltaproteobacteria bacterium]